MGCKMLQDFSLACKYVNMPISASPYVNLTLSIKIGLRKLGILDVLIVNLHRCYRPALV